MPIGQMDSLSPLGALFEGWYYNTMILCRPIETMLLMQAFFNIPRILCLWAQLLSLHQYV